MIQIVEAHFEMDSDQTEPAYDALMKFYLAVKDHPFFEDSFADDQDEAFDLEDFFDKLGYSLTRDGTDDIAKLNLYLENEYIGEEYLFAVMAPFVRPGSYVNARIGESHYRWEFDGVQLMEFTGEIHYTNHHIVKPNDFIKSHHDWEEEQNNA